MEGEPFYEPINLLVLAENDEFRDTFIEDLKGFLQSENYEPADNETKYIGKTSFSAFFRDFCIISSPAVLNDTSKDISSKLYKYQEHFMEPSNLDAIIFLMRPDPRCYEQFLSLNLFTNFSKEDMEKIEKNVMFVFVHDDPVSSQKRDMVDADLWTVLDRIGADLLCSKTFHYNSRLNKDCQNAFMQFIYKNKRTLLVETVYSHESVLKVLGNEDFLDLLLEALIINEDNLDYIAKDETLLYVLCKEEEYFCKCKNCLQICCYCNEITTKSHLKLCIALINNSTCTMCKCSINDHEGVKYKRFWENRKYYHNKELFTKYRRYLIAIVVAIDMFHMEYNKNVGQLYERLKETIKKKPCYSIVETWYNNEKDYNKKRISADSCMKCIWKLLPNLMNFKVIEEELHNSLLLSKRNLCVSVESRKSAKLK